MFARTTGTLVSMPLLCRLEIFQSPSVYSDFFFLDKIAESLNTVITGPCYSFHSCPATFSTRYLEKRHRHSKTTKGGIYLKINKEHTGDCTARQTGKKTVTLLFDLLNIFHIYKI